MERLKILSSRSQERFEGLKVYFSTYIYLLRIHVCCMDVGISENLSLTVNCNM